MDKADLRVSAQNNLSMLGSMKCCWCKGNGYSLQSLTKAGLLSACRNLKQKSKKNENGISSISFAIQIHFVVLKKLSHNYENEVFIYHKCMDRSTAVLL